MAIPTVAQTGYKLIDKRTLQKAVAELDARMGFVPDPTATAEQAQELMLAQGIRPEDRFLSGEILRLRSQWGEE